MVKIMLEDGDKVNWIEYKIYQDPYFDQFIVWWIRGSTKFIRVFTTLLEAKLFIQYKKQNEDKEVFKQIEAYYLGLSNFWITEKS